MLNDSDNKMMNAEDPKDEVTFKAASGVTYDFFFPGSGKWRPMSVRAQTREEAQQYWEANRKPVSPEEERSEEKSDITNNNE
jgi:hypothetical protein